MKKLFTLSLRLGKIKKTCAGSHQLFSMTLIAGMGAMLATPSFSNGLVENRPWQFQTTADKANKAAVLDIIERKKGGFYDGFNTYNTTNIGSQINCNNSANATGNIADNVQAGPNTEANGDPNISADSAGNSDADTVQSDGLSAGESNNSGSQENSGKTDSTVDGSDINNSSGDVTNGNTNQDLNNDQDNMGAQDAGVDGSTACDLQGTTVHGVVNTSGNGALN